MPAMGCLDAIRYLRTRGYDKPIAAFTANAMKQDFSNCVYAGYNDFFTKPINRDRSYEILARYLVKRSKIAGI